MDRPTRPIPPLEPRVVVGVDGSEPNRAAVAYAIAEAAAAGRPLVPVGAVQHLVRHEEDALDGRHWSVLGEIERQVEAEHPGMRTVSLIEFDHPVPALLGYADVEDLLVVGKRGLGGGRRLLVGSTAMRVAGRSLGTVVVVPPGWRPAEHVEEPVVVGVDPDSHYEPVLRAAFERARRDRVELVVLHAVNLRPVLIWDPTVNAPLVRDGQEHSSMDLESVIKPLREEYPAVRVTIERDRGRAAGIILARSIGAQLIVLGRRHDGRGTWGLGPVAREVIHQAEVPVAVVPCPAAPTGRDR
ncbi:universal stress protein [Nocardioides luteus]|uniref:universal stress protein n=1 Tax=Nocardioides luteus TaxID=1844 RepID=UPI0018CB2AF2|nr:universal stress protein [Nocardioides luteus]MBG6096962.1 nucleotide-binding universal stress UspA family protein [Nocardioides luteus]